jgi:hypothetical protein
MRKPPPSWRLRELAAAADPLRRTLSGAISFGIRAARWERWPRPSLARARMFSYLTSGCTNLDVILAFCPTTCVARRTRRAGQRIWEVDDDLQHHTMHVSLPGVVLCMLVLKEKKN